MTMPLDINARRYYRVAYQRLEDGRLMLERLARPKAAIYLTGYAVECIAKALIISCTPMAGRADVLRSFRGAAAHDLMALRARVTRCGVGMPYAVAREWAYVASWSVELRYEPGGGDAEEAQRFLNAAQSVVNWANGRM